MEQLGLGAIEVVDVDLQDGVPGQPLIVDLDNELPILLHLQIVDELVQIFVDFVLLSHLFGWWTHRRLGLSLWKFESLQLEVDLTASCCLG